MIGLIMNCRGVGKKGFAFSLRNMMSDFDPDFIGLQETMKNDYTPPFFRKMDHI